MSVLSVIIIHKICLCLCQFLLIRSRRKVLQKPSLNMIEALRQSYR